MARVGVRTSLLPQPKRVLRRLPGLLTVFHTRHPTPEGRFSKPAFLSVSCWNRAREIKGICRHQPSVALSRVADLLDHDVPGLAIWLRGASQAREVQGNRCGCGLRAGPRQNCPSRAGGTHLDLLTITSLGIMELGPRRAGCNSPHIAHSLPCHLVRQSRDHEQLRPE